MNYERHLVIFKKSSPGNVKKESDYIGAKFYYQMPFISSSELKKFLSGRIGSV